MSDVVGVAHFLNLFVLLDELDDLGERVGMGVFFFESQSDGGVKGVVGVLFEIVAENLFGHFRIFSERMEFGTFDKRFAFETEFVVAYVRFWNRLVDRGYHCGRIYRTGGLLRGGGEK